MGCNKSVPKVTEPSPVTNEPSPKEEEDEHLEEDTKSIEKYSRPYREMYGDEDGFRKERNGGRERFGRSDMMSSKDLSQKMSEVNLHKIFLESIRKEDGSRRLEKLSETMIERNEESTYKITQVHHELICRFVEEKHKLLQDDIFNLHAYLFRHTKPGEELQLIIEDLKDNNKDIENCIDDLKAYPLANDEVFYSILAKNDKLAKDLTYEYGIYKKNIKNYSEFRESALNLLKKYNPSQTDDKTQQKKVNEKVLQAEDGKGSTEIPNHSHVSSLTNNTSNDTQEKISTAIKVYNELIEHFNNLKENTNILKEMAQVISGQYNKENSRKIAEIRQLVIDESPKINGYSEAIEKEIIKILTSFEDRGDNHVNEISDLQKKLRSLRSQVKQQQQIIRESLQAAQAKGALNSSQKSEGPKKSKSISQTRKNQYEVVDKEGRIHTYGSAKMISGSKIKANKKIEERPGDIMEPIVEPEDV